MLFPKSSFCPFAECWCRALWRLPRDKKRKKLRSKKVENKSNKVKNTSKYRKKIKNKPKKRSKIKNGELKMKKKKSEKKRKNMKIQSTLSGVRTPQRCQLRPSNSTFFCEFRHFHCWMNNYSIIKWLFFIICVFKRKKLRKEAQSSFFGKSHLTPIPKFSKTTLNLPRILAFIFATFVYFHLYLFAFIQICIYIRIYFYIHIQI